MLTIEKNGKALKVWTNDPNTLIEQGTLDQAALLLEQILKEKIMNRLAKFLTNLPAYLAAVVLVEIIAGLASGREDA